ncbi:Putative Diguanylate cyclase/phosphodiesterase(Diguanylate phosphodiesterase, EAL domain,12-240;Adenylyl cyclase class-3/4/guanylyl cyclase,407-519) [Magnetospirillum sp. XM-1]|uniref:GGDEF domain-containing protein n=1 Tax=Magnetospirillum sp. XM-1 TaxID=1663591 RepID=UPI00073DFF65|nr:GGDEF domain-containing protein [Magnetospirillum sp. XM-1]CUW38378.1 Putative Diguanylate cyclase/phosphodiesterase(Diguanylate phosphodiesterase, EAL domain,12-240;Adenylyl cyclase class-3/4/guanylyl cyclase,407-519) [Magnetospirillum sp. XM-1]
MTRRIDDPHITDGLTMALQPVVGIHSGDCHGYEALLRGTEAAGFESIQAFFDHCHAAGCLAEVELALRDKAVAAFASLAHHPRTKLFLNIDNRVLSIEGDSARRTRAILDRYGVPDSAVVFEISERHPLEDGLDAVATFRHFKRQGFRLAIDDFGTGFSGLQLLYYSEPDYLKIDRFFVADIAADSKKKVFLAHIVTIAHLLGAVVVAEGVETEREFRICKEIGCDMVQGWLVQRPTVQWAEMLSHYPEIERLARQDRRAGTSDQRIIADQIARPEPLALDTPMEKVFERFRADKSATFFPVVDGAGAPVGIVRDQELKDYTYSPFGRELIANKCLGRSLKDFAVRCPVADIAAKAEQILEAYSAVERTEGILIVDDMRYVGFLSADSLLRVINEKNLATARDQNPLTRLPGNARILSWVCEALENRAQACLLAYFDFDNFKPFNDKYGFRLGDRAILVFGDLLAKAMAAAGGFAGHIGGDDFFAGFLGESADSAADTCRKLIADFAHDVESFYDDETRGRGHIVGQDRLGNTVRFPLMTVSCVAVHLTPGCGTCSSDDISRLLADHKKAAKQAADHLVIVHPCPN